MRVLDLYLGGTSAATFLFTPVPPPAPAAPANTVTAHRSAANVSMRSAVLNLITYLLDERLKPLRPRRSSRPLVWRYYAPTPLETWDRGACKLSAEAGSPASCRTS